MMFFLLLADEPFDELVKQEFSRIYDLNQITAVLDDFKVRENNLSQLLDQPFSYIHLKECLPVWERRFLTIRLAEEKQLIKPEHKQYIKDIKAKHLSIELLKECKRFETYVGTAPTKSISLTAAHHNPLSYYYDVAIARLNDEIESFWSAVLADACLEYHIYTINWLKNKFPLKTYYKQFKTMGRLVLLKTLYSHQELQAFEKRDTRNRYKL